MLEPRDEQTSMRLASKEALKQSHNNLNNSKALCTPKESIKPFSNESTTSKKGPASNNNLKVKSNILTKFLKPYTQNKNKPTRHASIKKDTIKQFEAAIRKSHILPP